MKRLVVLSTVTAALCGWPVAGQRLTTRFERSLDAMGTTYTVVLYGEDRFRLESVADDAFEEVTRLDSLLSNYSKDSEWSRINQLAASQPVVVSAELFGLLERCAGYSRQSEGAFDITVGPLMKVWGFYKGTGRLPHRAEVRTALMKVGYTHLQLDRARQAVRFDRPGVEIDPGGIGKGYAVEKMVEIFRRLKVASAFITAGRSTMYGLGTPPDEPRGWRVVLPNPRKPSQTAFELFLKNESMSTSGTSEKFFVAGGKTYSHIMDPRTGWPAQGMLSASVVAPHALDSEAWTKPVFIQGRTWTAAHKPKDARAYLCEDRLESTCVSLP